MPQPQFFKIYGAVFMPIVGFFRNKSNEVKWLFFLQKKHHCKWFWLQLIWFDNKKYSRKLCPSWNSFPDCFFALKWLFFLQKNHHSNYGFSVFMIFLNLRFNAKLAMKNFHLNPIKIPFAIQKRKISHQISNSASSLPLPVVLPGALG